MALTPSRKVAAPSELRQKWNPLLREMDEVQATLTAWVMEHEARFLQEAFDTGDAPSGVGVRFIFPTLRRAIPTLGLQSSYAEIRVALEDALKEIAERDSGCVKYDLPIEADAHALLGAMAERAFTAFQTFPKS